MTGRFLMDDSKFYTINEQTNRINVFDMIGESLYAEIEIVEEVGYQQYHPLLKEVQPISNGERLYIIASFGAYFNYFMASYYPDQDSIGIRYELGSLNGEIAVTPDESQLIFTDPWWSQQMSGSGNIIFADISRDRPTYVLPCLYSIIGHGATIGFNPGRFAITPDSKYMLMTGGPGSGEIYTLIDLVQCDFGDIIINDPDSIVVGPVWCQKFFK
jgi:hypothetical protein